jgi:hypothetical protein
LFGDVAAALGENPAGDKAKALRARWHGLRSWREHGGGQVRLPLLTDHDRWRRVIFDVPAWMMVQLMNHSVTCYRPSIDMEAITQTLTRVKDQKQEVKFMLQQVGQDQIIFDGDMDGALATCAQTDGSRQICARQTTFSVGSEYPFNR